MQPSSAQADDPEPEELVRFRRDWLRELEQANARRRPEPDHLQTPTIPSPASVSKPNYTEQQPGPSSQTIAGGPTASLLQASHGTTVPTRSLTSAIDTYRRAVEFERQSRLDDALQLYRQAFRMDSNVDKAYHKAEQQQRQIQSANSIQRLDYGHKKAESLTDTSAIDKLTRGLGALSVKHTGAVGGIVTGTFASLLENFPRDLVFEPEDERNQVPLNVLPDEMLVLILRGLDPTGIERFAAVNRKARVVSLDSTIWR
jgi:F-box protein 9